MEDESCVGCQINREVISVLNNKATEDEAKYTERELEIKALVSDYESRIEKFNQDKLDYESQIEKLNATIVSIQHNYEHLSRVLDGITDKVKGLQSSFNDSSKEDDIEYED